MLLAFFFFFTRVKVRALFLLLHFLHSVETAGRRGKKLKSAQNSKQPENVNVDACRVSSAWRDGCKTGDKKAADRFQVSPCPFVNYVNRDVTDPLWMSHCPNRIIMRAESLPAVVNCARYHAQQMTCVHTRFARGVCLTLTSLPIERAGQVRRRIITRQCECERF